MDKRLRSEALRYYYSSSMLSDLLKQAYGRYFDLSRIDTHWRLILKLISPRFDIGSKRDCGWWQNNPAADMVNHFHPNAASASHGRIDHNTLESKFLRNREEIYSAIENHIKLGYLSINDPGLNMKGQLDTFKNCIGEGKSNSNLIYWYYAEAFVVLINVIKKISAPNAPRIDLSAFVEPASTWDRLERGHQLFRINNNYDANDGKLMFEFIASEAGAKNRGILEFSCNRIYLQISCQNETVLERIKEYNSKINFTPFDNSIRVEIEFGNGSQMKTLQLNGIFVNMYDKINWQFYALIGDLVLKSYSDNAALKIPTVIAVARSHLLNELIGGFNELDRIAICEGVIENGK